MRIRREQMEAFADAAERDFMDRMVRHLEAHFPAATRALGEAGTREVIRRGVRRAENWRITREDDLARFVDLSFVLGPEFDTDPNLPWAQEILCRTGTPVSLRLHRVYLRSLQHLEKESPRK